MPQGTNPLLQEQEKLRREADTWFIVSLISVMCCCVFGAIGAILAYQAKDLLVQQKFEEAQAKLKAAKTIALIGIGIGVLIPLLQVAAYMLSFVLAF